VRKSYLLTVSLAGVGLLILGLTEVGNHQRIGVVMVRKSYLLMSQHHPLLEVHYKNYQVVQRYLVVL